MTDNLGYKVNLKDDLYRALKAITTPGTFAAWEALPTTPPAGLHVDGVGDIAMPLSEEQARQLITKAHQAPYGRRSETLVDLSVRNTWEINGDQLQFLDPGWQGYLLDVGKLVATNLGIEGPIRLDLYKMLIYEKDAMFKPHTDTEKIPGMFGTLIICLPSAHTGGEVVVKHNGESKTLRTSDASQSFACWYSDVTHEVLPVKSGYRWVLTYNLATSPGHTRPAASALDSHIGPLRETLQVWLRDLASGNTTNASSHLYHALDHEYTEAAMSLKALKAKDFARVQALQDLASQLPFRIFLTLLEKKEEGGVEPDWDAMDRYKRGRYDFDDPDSEDTASYHSFQEVYDISYFVKSLRALDGTIIAEDYEFDTGFCLVDDPFADLEIDREDYESYTGNTGPSATHWYRRSALVIVPDENLGTYFDQCASGWMSENRHSALRYLGKLCSLPSAPRTMLDAMCVLCTNEPRKDPSRWAINDILKTASQRSHYGLFKAVAACHEGHLPAAFFDWAKQWLNTLPDADRAEKHRSWIPLLIQGYPSVADRFSIIKKMSPAPTGDVAVSDAAPASPSTWAKDLIRQSITSLLATTETPTRSLLATTEKTPTEADGRAIVSAAFYLNDGWPSTSQILTSIFDRFQQPRAAAFCLAVLSQLKTEGQAPHLPMSDIMELHKSLSLRVFGHQRQLCQLLNAAQANKISAVGLTVTPQALVEYACNLNDMSADAENFLGLFIQEIIAQCATFSAEDMRELWMPFFYKLVPALVARSVSLTTSCCQQLSQRFLKHLDDRILGPCPRAGVSHRRPQVHCSCADCSNLNRFLQDADRRVGRFAVAKPRRQHLHRQLDGARIDCTHETERIGSPQTLVVTKRKTLKDEVAEWKRHQKEIYGVLTQNVRQDHLQALLGLQQAARVRSLAGLVPEVVVIDD